MMRLSLTDLVRTALIGPRSRPLRTVLSALGIAVGIAALTAITGITASNQAELLAQLDDQGADLLVLQPGAGPDDELVPLPDTAAAMVARLTEVEQVGALEKVPDDIQVYRNDLVPEAQTNGLSVHAAGPAFLDAIEGSLAAGRWFDETTRRLPVTVLGAAAAARLGVDEPGVRIWVGDRWYAVIGILDSAGLAQDVDASVFLGDGWAREQVSDPDDDIIAALYVRVEPGQTGSVREIIAKAANPWSPYVYVSPLSDLVEARQSTDDALSGLALGLAAVALLVGGIGIANTMVVAVLERRGEVGLRRALGARPGQIAAQFVCEAIVLAGIGGIAGATCGALGVLTYATLRRQALVLPPEVLLGGPLVALVIGVIAGLYPALSAARLPPTTALRAV